MKKLLGVLILFLVAGDSYSQGVITTYPSTSVTNAAVNSATAATLGAELAPAITAANWTCGAGWDTSVAGTLNKNADGSGSCAPNGVTLVVGTTYRVSITVATLTVASGATYIIGGAPGPFTPLTSVNTFTDYFMAVANSTLVITPAPPTTRFTITAVSIKALTDGTGDLLVEGNLTTRSPVLVPDGSAGFPGLGFANDSDTGFYRASTGQLVLTSNGTFVADFSSSIPGMRLYNGASSIALSHITAGNFLLSGITGSFDMRQGTSPQTFNIYNTFTDASNYERASVGWAANLFSITIGNAGSGTARGFSIVANGATKFAYSVSGDYLALTSGDIASQTFRPTAADAFDLGMVSSSLFWKNVYISRSIQGSKIKALNEGSATSIVQIAIPAGDFAAGTMTLDTYCADATNRVVDHRILDFVCQNTGGTESCGTVIVSGATNVASSGGTFTTAPTLTFDASPTNAVNAQITAACSLTQTTLDAYWRLNMMKPQTITPQ